MNSAPLLTLLFGARNDSYMGDFKWRFSTCMNLLAQNLHSIGRSKDVEVLVVDWNSDVPLHTVLPLSEEARDLARFIVVPPEIARPAQRDSPFPIPIVQNVAIRRARGEFIGQTDTDILFTRSSLQALFHVLDGRWPELPVRNSLMVASRRHVPFQQVLRKPSLAHLEAYLARNAAVFPQEPFFSGFATPSALALLHRDIWQSCRGYDESLIYWGWMEIDLYLRLTQRIPWYDIAGFGVNLLHLEHYVSRTGPSAQSRKMNPMNTSVEFEANDANWGLNDRTLESAKAAPDAPALQAPETPHLTSEGLARALADADLREFVEKFCEETRLPPAQGIPLLPLAWYARERHPRNFVAVGARLAATAALVAMGCPGTEIYGIDSWRNDGLPAEPAIWAAANVIGHFGRRQNYTRFVTGKVSDSLERLFASPSAPSEIDLAHLQTDSVFGNPVENAIALARRLSPGGAISIFAGSPVVFDAVWSALLAQLPGCVAYRPVPQSAPLYGMVIAAASGSSL